MFYVYMYLTDGVPWYVGKGCKYRRRHYQSDIIAKEHARPENDSDCIIVKDNLSEAAAFELEIELIAKYKRQCDGGTLLNKCLGGAGTRGFKHDPSRPSAMKGRKHSASAKAKMSQAKQGNSCRAGTVTYLLTKPDGTQVIVKNLANYCRKHKLNRKCLTNVLCGRSKTHKGYTIKRIEEDT
jgi:hypothetical protein